MRDVRPLVVKSTTTGSMLALDWWWVMANQEVRAGGSDVTELLNVNSATLECPDKDFQCNQVI